MVAKPHALPRPMPQMRTTGPPPRKSELISTRLVSRAWLAATNFDTPVVPDEAKMRHTAGPPAWDRSAGSAVPAWSRSATMEPIGTSRTPCLAGRPASVMQTSMCLAGSSRSADMAPRRARAKATTMPGNSSGPVMVNPAV